MTIRVALVAMALTIGAWAMVTRQPTLDGLARRSLATIQGEVAVPHLRSQVRVARDEWGIPHISANSPEDLFFAQGYVIAQDRLWQMEIWRRAAEGRMAEIVGPRAVARDRIARLLRYRGPVDDQELAGYHPDARRLMTAFVSGVNAYIEQHKDRLPVEFVLTGIVPEPWTIDTLVLRQTTFGDAANELQLANAVAALGAEAANRRANPDPWDDLTVPAGLNVSIIDAATIAAARVVGGLPAPEILPSFRSLVAGLQLVTPPRVHDPVDPGSNNWVVSGALSSTGMPVIVNDPHREVTLPSLRYIVHLRAPGWNVAGATEPPFLSIAAGHNERLGWGLTIVGTDQHDVFVEEVNPANPNEVKSGEVWEPLRIVREEIRVKGESPVVIDLKFSRNGPIFYEDLGNKRAYALKSALHERGTAPYLAGLRLSQARDCRAFLDEATHWYAPSENLVCGDVDGNIAWRASALTPRRRGWSGRLPVPGTGTFAWQGFRDDLPQLLNPRSGLIATANHNVQPKGFSPPFMFKDADVRFDRITRLQQLLSPDRKYSLEDHRRIQLDAFSLRAHSDLSLFKEWKSSDAAVERARLMLVSWDAVYRRDSPEAAIYQTWLAAASRNGTSTVEENLRRALADLRKAQGSDPSTWRWGRMHARAFSHPLARAFDLPAVERPGGAGTVAADGATYREILDSSNWDRSLVTNTPGQSGQPGSPFYGNLLPLWAEDRYFPLLFTQPAIDRHTTHALVLKPAAVR